MLNFLKKNGYYIMLAVCLICIGTMITLAVTYNSKVDELNKPKTTVSPSASPKASVTPSASPSPTTPVSTDPVEFTVPCANATVGLDYTMETFVFSETLNQWQTHSGIDFLTSEPADVCAAADGTVTEVITDDILNGNTVVIDHGNGLCSYYMSLSSEIPVSVGDKVVSGDVIGQTSMSAYSEFKEGAHLHYEMTSKGELVNPNDYFGDLK